MGASSGGGGMLLNILEAARKMVLTGKGHFDDEAFLLGKVFEIKSDNCGTKVQG